MLFSRLSLSCGRKSTIITTKLPFKPWNEIFGDTLLTPAIVDRLTHRAFIGNMESHAEQKKPGN